jgi:hypothetical protein
MTYKISGNMNQIYNIYTPSKSYRKIFWLMPPVFLVGAMAFLLIDIIGGSAIRHSGVIVEKSYTPERIRLIKVKELQPKGEFATYLTAETEPAEWAIFARSESGRIIRMECGRDLYYGKNIGESVRYAMVQGWVTSWPYYTLGIVAPSAPSNRAITPVQAFRRMKIRTASL